MAHLIAIFALSFSLCVVLVQSEIGTVHSGDHISADAARKELKSLLNGKSQGDILELRKELAARQKQRGHHTSSNKHPKCPPGFGSQRSDGCCASKWADDLTQAKYECQESTQEDGKPQWEVFTGGANSKFTCCPKEQSAKNTLKEDLDELKRLVAEKEKLQSQSSHKVHQKKHQDVDWQKEEDTSEEEMRNQLHLGGGKKKSRKIQYEEDTPLEKEAFNKVLEEQEMRKWEEAAAKQAAAEGNTFSSFLQLVMAIPFVIAVVVGYLIMIEQDLRAVEIPGLGTVNLQKAVYDLTGGNVKKVTHNFDATPLHHPPQGSYGSSGGYGSGDTFASYQTHRPLAGVGEGQSLIAPTSAAPVRNFAAMSPEEDLGL